MSTADAPRSPSTRGDLIFRWVCQAAGGLILGIAAALVVSLVVEAWPVLSQPSKFPLLTSTNWDPHNGSYGALVFVYGTLVTSVIAIEGQDWRRIQ